MLSQRQLKRRRGAPQGGIYEYVASPEDVRKLANILSRAKSQSHLKAILGLLLTNREMVDIVRRIAVAEMLLRGKTYDEIYKSVGSSKMTISLVKQALSMGEGLLAKAIGGEGREARDVENYITRRIRKGK